MNRSKIIKEHLYNEYELELISYSSIQFKIFPQPNITLQNIQLQFKNSEQQHSGLKARAKVKRYFFNLYEKVPILSDERMSRGSLFHE